MPARFARSWKFPDFRRGLLRLFLSEVLKIHRVTEGAYFGNHRAFSSCEQPARKGLGR